MHWRGKLRGLTVCCRDSQQKRSVSLTSSTPSADHHQSRRVGHEVCLYEEAARGKVAVNPFSAPAVVGWDNCLAEIEACHKPQEGRS